MWLMIRSLVFALALMDLPSASTSVQTTSDAQDCDVKFLADVTVPDGTPVRPGQTFDKVWLVSNCGSEPWTDVRAVPVHAGEYAGDFGTDDLPVAATEPGRPAQVYARLVAPQEPGCHRATYQLSGPDGLIGSTFWADVLVVGPQTPVEQTWRLDDLLKAGVQPEDVGSNWEQVHLEGFERKGCARGPGYSRWYSPSTDFAATGRPDSPQGPIVGVIAQVHPDVQAADAEVQKSLNLDPNAQPVRLGDGSALRSARGAGTTYYFRVGSVSAAASVGLQNGEADTATLATYDTQALALAQQMIGKLRAILAQPVPLDPQALLVGPPPPIPDLRPLALPISALPGAWSVLPANDTGWRYSVTYESDASPDTSAYAAVTLSLEPDPDHAIGQVETRHQYLSHTYTATPWENHDAAYRFQFTKKIANSITTSVWYIFHVGPYYAEVTLDVPTSSNGQLDSTSEALRLATLQETLLTTTATSP
jgi:hypothetical protein